MKILFVLLLIFVVVFLLSLVKVKVNLTYDNEFGFVLKYGMFKIYSNKKKNSKQENLKNTKKQSEGTDDYTDKLKNNISTIKEMIFDVFLKFKKYLVFEFIEFKYDYGFKDAALTGVFYGVASTLSNIFLSYMDNTFKVKKIINEINPDFNNTKHKITFNTSFGIRLMYLFSIIIKFVKFISKLK